MTAAEINNLPEWLLDVVSYLSLGGWVYWAFLTVAIVGLVVIIAGIFDGSNGDDSCGGNYYE